MPRGFRLYLEDMAASAAKIMKYVGASSYEDFVRDGKTYDAVIRNLEIIGEAARQVPEEVKARYPAVEWRKVYLFRNVLAHEYFGISNELLWDIIKNRLPSLLREVEAILEREP